MCQSQTQEELENDVNNMITNYMKDFPTQPFCTIEQLNNYYIINNNNQYILKDNIILIDNRTTIEQNVSMLPYAITKTQFENNINNISNESTDSTDSIDYSINNCNKKHIIIIIYCTIGYRSARYTNELLNRGYMYVYNSPGILKWCHYHYKQYQYQLNNTKDMHGNAVDDIIDIDVNTNTDPNPNPDTIPSFQPRLVCHEESSNTNTNTNTNTSPNHNPNTHITTNNVHVFADKWNLIPDSYHGITHTKWECSMIAWGMFNEYCIQLLGWR